MRLHSSKFVFFLLLVCSVQTTEEYALRLVAGVVSGRASHAPQSCATASAVRGRDVASLPHLDQRARPIRLDAAARAAQKTAWSMRRPASESAAIFSFTGFLRA